jgi:hypothetical protein
MFRVFALFSLVSLMTGIYESLWIDLQWRNSHTGFIRTFYATLLVMQ